MTSVIILQKKTSWILLSLLFLFDAIVSYWGVVYMHGREADLLIASVVEKYPILYFPLAPVLVGIIYVLEKSITKGAAIFILKRWRFTDENILERILLSAIVLYWAVGNSSDNMIFILGYRISDIWVRTALVAIPITLLYILYALRTNAPRFP